MAENDLYIAEIGEALKFYKENTYEYLRLSIILFDNVIEVMLKNKLRKAFFDKYYKEGLSFIEIDNKLKKLEHHEEITKNAIDFNIINKYEKKVLDFCHKIRNLQYHEPRERTYFLSKNNEVLIRFGALALIDFLITNFLKLMPKNEFEFYLGAISDRRQKVYKKNDINIPEQIILKLTEQLAKSENKPNELLQELINDDIQTIEEFFESEATEDWEEFYNITLDYFKQYLDYIKQERNKNIDTKIKNFKKLSDKKIIEVKRKYYITKIKNIGEVIEKYITFSDEFEDVLSGIMFYKIEQDRLLMLYDS